MTVNGKGRRVATGPCRRHGVIDRNESGNCRLCAKEQLKRWLSDPANYESALNRNRDCYAKKREYRKAKSARWRTEHPEQNRASVKRWASENKEARKALENKRRALKKNSSGSYTANDVARIISEQNGLCAYCREPLPISYHIDHKIPLSRGGSNCADNICCACPRCNTRKNAMTDAEFIAKLKREHDNEKQD